MSSIKPCIQGRLMPISHGSDLDKTSDNIYRLKKPNKEVYTQHGFRDNNQVKFDPLVKRKQIYPTKSTHSQKGSQPNMLSPKDLRNLLNKKFHRDFTADNIDFIFENPAPSPNYSPRTRSPVASKTAKNKKQNIIPLNKQRSLHWRLSTEKHVNFDTKGQLRNQGPFSRPFSIKVTASNCWLKRRWDKKN